MRMIVKHTMAMLTAFCGVMLVGTTPAVTAASKPVDVTWAIRLAETYSAPLVYNITYSTTNNFDARLDVYVPSGGQGKRRPALLYIHGGGWMPGYTKESVPFAFLPFLQLGWDVVKIDYRPSSVSPAPAAVEDCLCALRWVARNADAYGIDLNQLVLMGHSAGGHLALTTGMIPLSTDGLGSPCDIADMHGQHPAPPIRPAAIINWFGIADVADLIDGPNLRGYAVRWVGNQPDRIARAKSVSPLSYVRAGLPPIMTVHGEKDPLVPYQQAVRLHEALTAAGVTNKLVTIRGAGHGRFGVDATRDAYAQVFEFLQKAGVIVQSD